MPGERQANRPGTFCRLQRQEGLLLLPELPGRVREGPGKVHGQAAAIRKERRQEAKSKEGRVSFQQQRTLLVFSSPEMEARFLASIFLDKRRMSRILFSYVLSWHPLLKHLLSAKLA